MFSSARPFSRILGRKQPNTICTHNHVRQYAQEASPFSIRRCPSKDQDATVKAVESSTVHPHEELSSLEVRTVRPTAIPQTADSKAFREEDIPEVHVESNSLFIRWKDAEDESEKKISNLWLRDHCRCSKCVNQDTMQRAYETFAPANSKPKIKDITTNGQSLNVTWLDDHTSTYSWSWLYRHSFVGTRRYIRSKLDHVIPKLWDATIAASPPTIDYETVMANDAGVGTWTRLIRQYGFSFVDNVPPTPEATKTLLERIAFIRETHYGGFYDFTSDLTMKDTAYTSLSLSAHTDTTYFTDPAGLQMFHLLSHTGPPSSAPSSARTPTDLGGASLLVDGFACAYKLRALSPKAFEVLSESPIQWHASGNPGIIITPSQKQPVIGLGMYGHRHTIRQVRWNNDDRATIPLSLGRNRFTAEEWYAAARLWNEILTDKENEYWEQLKPGRALIFDNWRVLHGRSAFIGKRRMSGGYINRDDFISRYLNTNYHRDEILADIL